MKNVLTKQRNNILLGLLIFVLALLLRLYNLDLLPIFGDEAIYIRWAQVMRVEPSLRFLPLSDGKQPLFMWTVIPFFKIFSDPLLAGRLVSVFTGLGTLVGVFVLSYLLFVSLRFSLIASLVYAISPFSVFFDRLALADSMLTFFGVWALIFSVITVKKIRLDTAMLAGFSLGGAFLTKSPAIFFVTLIPLTLILHKWPKRLKEKFTRISVFVFLFTFTYLIALGMYNILRLGSNFHMIGTRNQDYIFPLTHILQSPLNPLVGHLKDVVNYLWLMGPSVLILLILTGIYVGWNIFRKEIIILLAWGILPILAVAEYSKTITARYIYFSIPYIFIVSTLTFSYFVDKKVKGANLFHTKDFDDELSRIGGLRSHFRVLIRIVFIVLVLHALFVDFRLLTKPEAASLPRSERSGYLEEWTAGTGIEEVSEIIREEYHRDQRTKIVVGTEGYFGTLPDGLQIYLNDIPEVIVIGVGIDIRQLPESLVESQKAGNKTYLVINDSRLLANPQDLGLELIAVYPKAFRKEGTREYNTLGPRDSLYLFEVREKGNLTGR